MPVVGVDEDHVVLLGMEPPWVAIVDRNGRWAARLDPIPEYVDGIQVSGHTLRVSTGSDWLTYDLSPLRSR